MLLFWRIRYLDKRDRQFKDRDLWLDTEALDPVDKAAVEATHELKDDGRRRGLLRYRHLFREKNHTRDELQTLYERHDFGSMFCIPDYFEDETGRELTNKEMAVALTGNQDAMMFPPGTRPHDIEFYGAAERPIPIDQVALATEQLNVLGYFVRDLRELLASAFYKVRPDSAS